MNSTITINKEDEMKKEIKIIKRNEAIDPDCVHIDRIEVDGKEMDAFFASNQWITENDLAFGLFEEQARKNTK